MLKWLDLWLDFMNAYPALWLTLAYVVSRGVNAVAAAATKRWPESPAVEAARSWTIAHLPAAKARLLEWRKKTPAPVPELPGDRPGSAGAP